MPSPYFEFGADPNGDRDSSYLTADQVGVGRLKPSQNMDGEWILSPVGPTAFNPVSFRAQDLDGAQSNARAWMDAYLAEHHEGLFADDEDE